MNYFAIPGFTKASTSGKRPPSLDEIANEVEIRTGVPVKDMKSIKRTREVAFARQLSIYLSRLLTKYSLKNIAAFFGGRDHTTAIHSIKAINDIRDTDENWRIKIDCIASELK